jgi:hypothetical protein
MAIREQSVPYEFGANHRESVLGIRETSAIAQYAPMIQSFEDCRLYRIDSSAGWMVASFTALKAASQSLRHPRPDR